MIDITEYVEQMANMYSFNNEKKVQLKELLRDEYAALWSGVIYGSSVKSVDIVNVAVSQLDNVGGQPYWSWYGFKNRIEWCACFVSWCANELGYLEKGIIPKFASCQSEGVAWFKACGLWKDKGFITKAGDIIFFDWEQDGHSDHVGIVERMENGKVYAIEGNSSNECKRLEYDMKSSAILVYGTPAY